MHKRFILIFSLLIILSLACSQAGEILTPEEATQRAQEGKPVDAENSGTEQPAVEGAQFQVGDQITFTSTGFLVPLYRQPGDRSAFSHVPRGDKGTILSVQNFEGTIWYQVSSVGGKGWIEEKFLKALETTPTAGSSTATP